MIFRAAFRHRSPVTYSPSNYLQRVTCLSSSLFPAAGNRTTHNFSGDEPDGKSTVYRDACKYARPSTVTWSERLFNSVSFIGTVENPIRRFATKNGDYGVYTFLRVKTSSDSHTSFEILLEFWDEMAERALQHLKPNDYIYVSGLLGSYSKASLNGIETLKYKVKARELNHVSQGEPEKNFQGVVKSESGGGESSMDKYRSRLHLWQVFFANPNEWYDNRKTKKTRKHPDFKHKTTGEALWLGVEDPPWVRKQIELLDSRLSGEQANHETSKPVLSRWAV